MGGIPGRRIFPAIGPGMGGNPGLNMGGCPGMDGGSPERGGRGVRSIGALQYWGLRARISSYRIHQYISCIKALKLTLVYWLWK